MLTIVQLNEHAVRDSIELVKQLTADDLPKPSTCEGWTVADLLAHMTAQHNGFAAAANGTGLDLRHWEVRAASPDEYVQAAERVIAAFAADGATERSFHIPEFSTSRGFPGAQAIGFHLIDYVIHSWDVARSVGRAYEPTGELLDKAYEIASLVPDGPERRQPGAAFGPALADDADDDRWHQVLRMLGRDPSWPASTNALGTPA